MTEAETIGVNFARRYKIEGVDAAALKMLRALSAAEIVDGGQESAGPGAVGADHQRNSHLTPGLVGFLGRLYRQPAVENRTWVGDWTTRFRRLHQRGHEGGAVFPVWRAESLRDRSV
jgi:hypothetical protein